MFGMAKTPNPTAAVYATSADFCRIFEKNMDRLYLLSLLLTGDQVAAERCFVQGLADSKEGNPVFREWAESWARRAIVQNAIQTIQPQARDIIPSKFAEDAAIAQPREVMAILSLPAFDRFAYVLSVLEGYSLQDCTLLLACSRAEVVAARMRALQQVVKYMELHRPSTESLNQQIPREDAALDRFSEFAATA